MILKAWSVAICLLLGAAAARAADGVIEINQASIEAAGGFPIEITESGSYRLTGNLTVDDVNTTAIWVRTPYVTVDLNGFSIQGPVECEFGESCDQAGTGAGVWGGIELPQLGPDGVMQCTIDAVPGGHAGVEVRNGVISGMGGDGVGAIFEGRVESIRVISNGGHGIEVSDSVVTGCVVSRNGLEGIAGGNSLIERNVVAGSGGVGIRAFGGAVIGNQARGNNSVFSMDGGGYGTNNFAGEIDDVSAGQLGCNVLNGVTICPPAPSP